MDLLVVAVESVHELAVRETESCMKGLSRGGGGCDVTAGADQ